MVTYSHQGGTKLQYVNGGANQTVTLTGVHLLNDRAEGQAARLIPVDSPRTRRRPCSWGDRPLPLLFTDVEADNAFLNTQSIVIPGFDGHGTDRPSAGASTRHSKLH